MAIYRKFFNFNTNKAIAKKTNNELAMNLRLENKIVNTLDKNLTAFNNSTGIVKKFFALVKNEIKNQHFAELSFFNKLHMIGLGYKNFLLDSQLYILIGDCNYIILEVPDEVQVICKKNQIYLISRNSQKMFSFSSTLKKIKKANFYKGKGVMEFSNFKFTKLKVGKKQRFM